MNGEALVEINLVDEIKKSYLDYALSVIIGRAIPDVNDGLKPVQRRIIYAMHDMGNMWNKPYKKSARIVGDVIGKYHPHGDAAVYEATVRMAQDFTMRYPLVDGQGNFGSMDGDPPAAMRYTEIRLKRISHELLQDIDKDTVRFVANYDSSTEEPELLPSKIPNLLINGGSGIAVGMATNIPPHNLGEVVDSLVLLLEDGSAGLEEILRVVNGPDFPTGGIIYGRKGLEDAYRSGRGSIKVRAKVAIEKQAAGQKNSLIVRELPYQVNKAKLLERMDDLIRNKTLEGIEELRDETDRDGMRIVINLKKNEITDVVLNKLFKHTAMEVNYSIIFLAIDDGMPKVFSIKELLEKFLLFRKDVVLKRTAHELKKSQEQCHILDGLRKALENIDLVLKIIRGSEDPRVAAENLMQRVGLSEKQARAILDMRLQRLTRLEKQKLMDEHAELVKKIADLENILADEKRVKAIVKAELLEIKSNYADERRTDIVEELDEITYEDMIFEENMVVTITHKGYIKRTPLSMYRTQKRGGRGKAGITIGDEDFVEDLFISSTHSYFLIFTDMGRVHWLKVHEIPEASRIAKGKPIVNLVTLQEGERVASILPIKEFREGTFVLMATQRGVVKRADVKAFSRPRTAGIHAITLDEGDKLISTMLTNGTEKVFLATMNGKAVKFEETQIRPMGRSARGIRGLRLRDNDCLIAMINISNVDPILTVNEKGFGKRTPVDSYRVQKRGGKGLTNVRITPKNGTVVNVLQVSGSDNILLITNLGTLIRIKASEIKQVGRSAVGVKLINLGEGETVVAAQKILEED